MHSRALVAVLLASAGWGMAGVGVRAAFEDGATTFTVVVVRVVIATLVVVGFAWARSTPISRLAWWHGALIGSARIGLAPVFFVASLHHISAGFEGLVITLIPVVTAAMARLGLNESLRRTQVVGLGLGLAGTALLIASGETGIADGSGSTLTGGALALGGVFFGSLSGVLSRRFAPRHDTTSLAVPMFVSGAAVATVAGFAARNVEFGSLTPASWQIVIALALGSTLLPFVATLYASAHTTAANVALTGYLAPIIAVIGGVVLLGEVVTLPLLVGGTITLVGVVLAARAAPRVPDLVE